MKYAFVYALGPYPGLKEPSYRGILAVHHAMPTQLTYQSLVFS